MKLIKAEMRPDEVEPYKSYGYQIPIVIQSNHPRFTIGTRFDYGFLKVALREGYDVYLLQGDKQ